MSRAFDRIRAGLEEALAHARGEKLLHEWRPVLDRSGRLYCQLCGREYGRHTSPKCDGGPRP